MIEVAQTEERIDAVRWLAPIGMGLGLLCVFLAGLMLASHATDDYAYGAGLAFAAWSLGMAIRYFDRHLPD